MSASSSGVPEAKIWSDAVGGDPDAFATIFDLHEHRVLAHSRRLVRGSHDAEDVTALVFFEAWRRRGSVRVVDGSIIGWLLVAVNNVVRNYDRTLRRHRIAMAKMLPPEPAADHAEQIQQQFERDDRAARLRKAFDRLSQRDQDVLTLCVLEEMSVAEAGKALGVPDGTVKSRLSRAKQRLAGFLPAETKPLDVFSEGNA